MRKEYHEDEQLIRIHNQSNYIKYIANPTEEAQLLTLYYDVHNFKHITNPCKEAIIKYVQFNGSFLRDLRIDQVDDDVYKEAIKSNFRAICEIDHLTYELIEFSIENCAYSICYFKDHLTEDLELKALDTCWDEIVHDIIFNHISYDNKSDYFKQEYKKLKLKHGTINSIHVIS